MGQRIDSRGRMAALLLYQIPLAWGTFRVNEGAGAAFFWREEMKQLPLSNSVVWYLQRHPEFFHDLN
ncbi:hypothetical protein LMG28140_05538 [Paraburkholderia metrosideri]|uniref:Uncharacterized protein n=2 Tax=Paraburkholderia metrosideri TaxID=580937 RepID=A0ABM8P2Y2_9BURK|nr:hypothetical protein LMG28140_05538 [Paraburkholderia metrosideri]